MDTGDTGSVWPKGRLSAARVAPASMETRVLLSQGHLPSHFCCKNIAKLEGVALQQPWKRVSAVTHGSGFLAIALSAQGKKLHMVGKTAFKGKWLG